MFIDVFQKQIWGSKYQYKNETFKGFCERLSSNVFFRDSELELRKKLFDALHSFKILFGGRINSNIGVPENGLTLFNCFISPTVKNPDSLEGILESLKNFTLTLKTEGGVGLCANYLRPANTLIRKIGVTTPGSIKFLEGYDKFSEIITSGSVSKDDSYQGVPTKKSIRKGATMVTMSICHPDIEDFINAKTVANRLTKCNMSVMVSDDFMKAVEEDDEWALWFPDINFDKYEAEWIGDFELWNNKGYPKVVYRTVKATDLWNLLLKNSYSRNEPGILFIDAIKRMDNLSYLDRCSITSTNPCIVAGTLVMTDKGLVKVEKIQNGDVIQTTLGFNKVKEVKSYKDEDVYRVTFNDGFYQDVTKGHIFHTMLVDKEARKTWNNNLRLSDIESGKTFVRKEWYKQFPVCGTTYTRDEGLLIGLYLGDGCFSNYSGFNLSSNSGENNLYIENLYKRLGGNIRVDDSEGNCYRYYMINNNLYLKELFSTLNIDPGNKTFSLESLLNTNKEFIIGLIDGLLSSDGNVNLTSRYTQVRFKNTSMLLHNLMKHLMLFVKADYKVYLSAEADEESLIYGRNVIRQKDCFEGVIENDSILNLYNCIGYLSHPNKNESLKTTIKTKQLNGVKWKTKIKSIEYLGTSTVYDIYEPESDDWNHEGYVSRGCGEVPGSTGVVEHEGKEYLIGDICCLGSLNIVKFYDVKTSTFNMEEFLECTDLLVRALDNVIDVSNYPLPLYKDGARLKRKIGVGIAGVGSLAMMMNMRYGSSKHVVFLEYVLHAFMNQLYRSSAILASEKGPFPLYSKDMLECGYIHNSNVLDSDVIELITKHGIRNSALAAIAPNGTLSILAGNVSGGLEPVYSTEFTRWNRVEGDGVDFKYPNIHKGEWFETDYFKEQKNGDEVVLMSLDNKYRIDKNTGLCANIVISDYGYKIAKDLGFEHTAGATELSIAEHMDVLSVFAKYIDQSCSKTINIPSDISFDDFASLYNDIHKRNVKGCTTYREGSTVGVLETTKSISKKSIKKQQREFLGTFKDHTNKTVIAQNVKLPEEYPAKGYVLRSEGKKWYLHVAFKDKACTKPFAVFVNTNAREDNVSTFNALENLSDLSKAEGLNGGMLEAVERKYAYQKNPVKICRMIGFLLRHNVDIYHIVRAMDDVIEAIPGTFVHRIKKFLCQFIEEIDITTLCPECSEKALIFKEGCYLCQNCGNTKC